MEHTGAGPHPESLIHGLSDGLEVAAEGRDGVPRDGSPRVLAVIPEVEQDEIELVQQQRPVGVVEVRGEPVAVAQQQARTVRVSVAPHRNGKLIVQPCLDGVGRPRQIHESRATQRSFAHRQDGRGRKERPVPARSGTQFPSASGSASAT